MDNLISRQVAIDAINSMFAPTPIQMDMKEDCLEIIENLPSAQPEIIRCKDCKYNLLPATSANANCKIFYGMTDQYGFCHMAERREVSE